VRLGIFTSHPIQYQAPWFRGLAKETDLEVFFAHRQTPRGQADGGFGVAFDWDVDLLAGYMHRFLNNVSRKPGVNHFRGCDTPEIADIIGKAESRKQKAERGGHEAESRKQKAETESGDFNSQPSPLNSSKRFDAFIVSGWQLKSYWQAVRACRRAKVPVLVRGDSQLLTPRSPLRRIAKEIVHRFLLRQFDGFLYVGQRNREYLKHYGAPDCRLFFVPHLVDNEWFRGKAEIARKQKAEIRRGWGIPEDAFCALFCGKFIPKKRPLDFVAAIQLLTAENAKNSKDTIKGPMHLLFVGSGELGAQLRARCRVAFDAEAAVAPSLPLSDFSISGPLPFATFAGFKNQSELPACYAAADVLVLPSDGGETWGLVVNEAMACGLPAIVSDAAGCAPDLIDESKTGFTYAVGNSAQLADRLVALHEMKRSGHDFGPALAAKMGTYSVASAVSGTLKAIEALTASKSK
jgi:glycosyltransferase involved in cell wall biosynthesis